MLQEKILTEQRMASNKVIPFSSSPYSRSNSNRICDWIFICIAIGILIYFGTDPSHHQQCIPGIGPECSKHSPSTSPLLDYPEKVSTVSYVGINIICPIVWLCVFCINALIIHCHDSLSNNQKYKIMFAKFEILLRCVALSITFTAVTTDIIKNSVGRPRPNYLNNDDRTGDGSKSFPSGHSSYIFSVSFLLTLFMFRTLRSVQNIFYFFDDDDDRKRMNENQHLMINERVNVLDSDFRQIEMKKILNVYNGDSYTFLWLFLYLRRCQMISLLIAICPTLCAVYVCCTRLTDYKHHYSDVIGGALIGCAYATLSFWYYEAEFYYGFRYDLKKICVNQNADK